MSEISTFSTYRTLLLELYKRYSDIRVGSGKGFKIPPSVMLNKYAYETKTSILEGVFSSPFSLYKRGIGKSVYCLKCLYNVYGKNIDEVMKHIVFMPHDFLRLFKEAVDKNIRINMIVWDDAGFWIGSSRWNNKFVKAIREFINVIRTHVVTLMVNAPRMREIARGVRDNLDIIDLVRIEDFYFDLEKRRSIVYMYDVDYLEVMRVDRRRSLPEPLISWVFKQYLEWYPLYEEKRKEYVKIGVMRTEEALKEISNEASRELEEISKSYEIRLNDLDVEKEVKLDEDEEDDEDST
ncbi:MAG: hypothetical protein QXZ63_07620 [Sulfolobales archaeon]